MSGAAVIVKRVKDPSFRWGRRRSKPAAPGTPLWVLTFADMMSLLLGFFIMLVALSEMKDKDQYNAFVEEVQKAFGMYGGGGKLPTKDDPANSLIERLEAMELRQREPAKAAPNDEPGMPGRDAAVTKVREGLLFAIGGRITFEPGSADLNEEARLQLREMVEVYKLRGTRNIVELRGHASAMENAAGYPDLWALSHARARSVMEYLTSRGLGLEADRFRLVANADREPLVNRAYTMVEQEPNRRVEVLVNESLVQAFTEPRSTQR